MVIGVSLSVFCVYYIFLIGGEDVADRGFLSPFWAMWAPNALFTGLGIVLLYIVTLGGTKRVTLARLVPGYRRAKLAAAATTAGRRPSAEVGGGPVASSLPTSLEAEADARQGEAQPDTPADRGGDAGATGGRSAIGRDDE